MRSHSPVVVAVLDGSADRSSCLDNHIIVPHDASAASSSGAGAAGPASMPSTSIRPAPLYLPMASSSGGHSLPPFLPPVPPYEAEADLALLSQFSAASSAHASQDFRDEVDAML